MWNFKGLKKKTSFLEWSIKSHDVKFSGRDLFCLVCCFRFTKLPKFPKSLSQANFCCLHSQICGGNTILGNKSLFCPKFLQLQLEPKKSRVFFRYVLVTCLWICLFWNRNSTLKKSLLIHHLILNLGRMWNDFGVVILSLRFWIRKDRQGSYMDVRLLGELHQICTCPIHNHFAKYLKIVWKVMNFNGFLSKGKVFIQSLCLNLFAMLNTCLVMVRCTSKNSKFCDFCSFCINFQLMFFLASKG